GLWFVLSSLPTWLLAQSPGRGLRGYRDDRGGRASGSITTVARAIGYSSDSERQRERTLGARAAGSGASGTGGPAGGIPRHAPARGQARRAPGSGPRLPHSAGRRRPVVARRHQALA